MNIVFVDNNPSEGLLLKELLQDININCNLKTINYGRTAKDYFSKADTYTESERPDLIILDKDLGAAITGFDLIKEIKKNTGPEKITVVMLTMYSNEADQAAAYKLGIDKYYYKPIDFEQYKNILRDMIELAQKNIT